MNGKDFVYKSILNGALEKGASQVMAKDQASLGLEEYKKGRFDKPDKLINEKIKDAVRLSKR